MQRTGDDKAEGETERAGDNRETGPHRPFEVNGFRWLQLNTRRVSGVLQAPRDSPRPACFLSLALLLVWLLMLLLDAGVVPIAESTYKFSDVGTLPLTAFAGQPPLEIEIAWCCHLTRTRSTASQSMLPFTNRDRLAFVT